MRGFKPSNANRSSVLGPKPYGDPPFIEQIGARHALEVGGRDRLEGRRVAIDVRSVALHDHSLTDLGGQAVDRFAILQ